MAAERATSEEVDRLHSAWEAMKERLNAQDSERGEEYDIDFHYAIAEASHNALLIKLFRTISEEFTRSVAVARKRLYVDTLNPQKLVEQHRRIYCAIKEHAPDAAARAMLQHLSYAERELRKGLRQAKLTAVPIASRSQAK
jgi:GntR family transcriptional repressor for pyruvate dehydrogenase complex